MTSLAARYSAYNPVEHLWSPLSKCLTSVRLSAVATGDDKPPCQIGGLSAEVRKEKIAEVFDNVIANVCNIHQKNATFDDFKVQPTSFNYNPTPYHDHDQVAAFFKAPLCDLKSSKYSTYNK